MHFTDIAPMRAFRHGEPVVFREIECFFIAVLCKDGGAFLIVYVTDSLEKE
jgi:hypothetical protein